MEPREAPPNTYWVLPERILAGGFPGVSDEWDLPDLLPDLLDFGVTAFVDLTEPHEHGTQPYEGRLAGRSGPGGRPIVHHRVAIEDFGIPTAEELEEILAVIERFLSEGHVIYLHCFMGVGRTATVAGCYRVSCGLTPAAALAELAVLREGTHFEGEPYPATEEQRDCIRHWARQRRRPDGGR